MHSAPVLAPPNRPISLRPPAAWPAGLARTRTREAWYARLQSAPPGLTLTALARRLRRPYVTTRKWAVVFGYRYAREARRLSEGTWADVDWSLTDAEIARRLGVSAAAARYRRCALGHADEKARTPADRFRDYVAARREALHGKSAREAAVAFTARTGLPLSQDAARVALRAAGVRPSRTRA